MSRRAMIALAATITAFVLVSIGGVASYAVRNTPSPTASSAKVPDMVSADVVRAREAEYRRVIEEANARLRAQEAAIAAVPIAEPAADMRVEHDDEDRAHEHHDRKHSRHHEDDDG